MNNLFEFIGNNLLSNGSNFPPEVKADVYFSERLQLFIEISTQGVWYYKPLEDIKEIKDFECDKIREQLKLNPSEEITHFHLYLCQYTNLYLLNGPIQLEEPKKDLIILNVESKESDIFGELGQIFKP